MIHIDGILYLGAALMLMVLPLKWVLSAVAAALLHELCHLAVLFLAGGQVKNIKVTHTGCVIDTGPIGAFRQFISILAGPVGSLSLLLFRCYAPELAVCGFFQGMYNLLPVLPLDGGRLLQLLLSGLIPGKAHKILSWIRGACCILLTIFGIAFGIQIGMRLLHIIFAVILCILRLVRKTPCKAAKSKVQ